MDPSSTIVEILNDGFYIRDSSDSYYLADCTCTLITTKYEKIIVDPRGSFSRQKLLESLSNRGLSPESITTVVCTHGHSDHIGNLGLFPEARHVVSYDVNKGCQYFDNDLRQGGNYTIVFPTPGHTADDVSVIVYNAFFEGTQYNKIVIAGDLFEHGADRLYWKQMSFDPINQQKNREKVLQLADVIVPGHGKPFFAKNFVP